jgi:hypothetical protein
MYAGMEHKNMSITTEDKALFWSDSSTLTEALDHSDTSTSSNTITPAQSFGLSTPPIKPKAHLKTPPLPPTANPMETTSATHHPLTPFQTTRCHVTIQAPTRFFGVNATSTISTL